MFGEESVHGAIVNGQDGDGFAGVDLGGEVGGGEVVVEGGEFREFGEDFGDVMSIGCGWRGSEEEEQRSKEKSLHCEQ